MRARINRKIRAATAALAPTLVAACAFAPLAHAAPPGSGWDLVFADEFNGTSLDTLKWNYNYSWGRTHNHRAYMRESQVIVNNGVLNLQAIAQRDPSAPAYVDTSDFGRQYLDYTSGAINSSGKFTASSGYFEARMKMQDTAGTWPAFWMLKSGWPPEIDVMEFPRGSSNANNQFWMNLHYTNSSNAPASYGWHDTRANLTTDFHTFGLAWSASAMTFYFDGAATHTITDANAIADASNMYLILNHAVGGWAGTPAPNSAFPIDFLTDWVRVWQQRPAGSNNVSNWNVSGGGSWDTSANWSGLVPKYGSQEVHFDRVGAAATAPPTATVTWDNSRTVGSITFSGNPTTGTTAYTIGDANAGLQLANGATADAFIWALSSSQADQTVNARLELYNNTSFINNMTDGHALVINGAIIGTGNLTVEGPGPVVFANNNTYTGNTYIDNGTAGPAVARVTRSRPFGTTGTVHVGQNGNATTARLEIQDNREIPNPITLYGRNNASVAIQNLGGTNLLSGTVTAQVGGSSYILQSDAGLLRLTAPLALTAAATGTRTFTLQGAGDGQITGRIENGSATVGITKNGTGTWSLDADNTYTGPTNVNAGKLLVNGTHATGAYYSIAPTATLGGAGVIDPAGANDVTVFGRLTPGNNGVGTLTVGSPASPNNLALARGGLLDIELAQGNSADRLTVNGRADLAAGRLNLSLTDGVLPAPGSTFRILSANSITGAFTRITGGLLGPAADSDHVRYASPTYDATGVTLTITDRRLGDANLDGNVDFNDLVALAQNYNAPTTATPDPWLSGDFTGDATVDFNDLVLLAQRYNTPAEQQQVIAFALPQVPEPEFLSGAALTILTLKRRRP